MKSNELVRHINHGFKVSYSTICTNSNPPIELLYQRLLLGRKFTNQVFSTILTSLGVEAESALHNKALKRLIYSHMSSTLVKSLCVLHLNFHLVNQASLSSTIVHIVDT